MINSKHKSRQVQNWKMHHSQIFVFTETLKLSDANYRSKQKAHIDGNTFKLCCASKQNDGRMRKQDCVRWFGSSVYSRKRLKMKKVKTNRPG